MGCECNKPDQQKWLSLFHAAGDENIGRTILRLAQLAVTSHQFEVAAAQEDHQVGVECDRKEYGRRKGLLHRRHVVDSSCGEPVRREVNR